MSTDIELAFVLVLVVDHGTTEKPVLDEQI